MSINFMFDWFNKLLYELIENGIYLFKMPRNLMIIIIQFDLEVLRVSSASCLLFA
jgi:hypothetical protein